MTPLARLQSLSARARSVLLAAIRCADEEGTVHATQQKLGRLAGLHRVGVVAAVAELRSAGIIHTGSSGPGHYTFLDVEFAKTLHIPPTSAPGAKPTEDREWRALRARAGGLERALRAAQQQREDAMRKVDEVLARGKHRIALREAAGLNADVEIAALRKDLLHAADCGHPDCERCDEILTRLEDGRPRYAAEEEIADRLRQAEALSTVATSIISAVRDRGMGSRARFAASLRALSLALDGKHEAALQLVRDA